MLVISATFVVLVLAGAGFSMRMVAGPTMADRVIALNGIVVVGMIAIVTHAMDTRNGAFLPVIVVLALVGFVGTSIVARYIEARDR